MFENRNGYTPGELVKIIDRGSKRVGLMEETRLYTSHLKASIFIAL